jgi:hypothetical protein
MSRTRISRARERFTTLGADEPDQLIGVPAGELLEWGWLIGALADWLADAPDSTGADAVATEFTRHFAGHPTRHDATWMLNHIAERIGGLLDGDRGQP